MISNRFVKIKWEYFYEIGIKLNRFINQETSKGSLHDMAGM